VSLAIRGGPLNRAPRANSGLTHIESTPLPVSLELRNDRRKEGAAAMKQQAIQYVALDVHQATLVRACGVPRCHAGPWPRGLTSGPLGGQETEVEP